MAGSADHHTIGSIHIDMVLHLRHTTATKTSRPVRNLRQSMPLWHSGPPLAPVASQRLISGYALAE
jgi:hypothetical protein